MLEVEVAANAVYWWGRRANPRAATSGRASRRSGGVRGRRPARGTICSATAPTTGCWKRSSGRKCSSAP